MSDLRCDVMHCFLKAEMMDGWTDARTDRWANRQTDRWADKQMDAQTGR